MGDNWFGFISVKSIAPSLGVLHSDTLVLPCALGRSGISHAKHEGDGATPAGRLRPVMVLYRPDRQPRPHTPLPLAALRPADGWCDDPADRAYNRPVELPYPGGHERLWRDDRLYDLVVVLDWNWRPARSGRGSAIFLHVAGPGLPPTAGCLALESSALRRLLPRLRAETAFIVG